MAERAGLRFGRVAEEYERVRPTYPDALIDRACSRADLGAGDTVVEIGCGTGKLTRALVARGLIVEAVEPDAELIAVARGIVPEAAVRFHQAKFEEVELPLGMFPAVFAATSYHWIDPDIGWQRVAGLLEPDGVLALLSHVGGIRGQVDEELVRVWRDVVPSDSYEPIDDDTLWKGVESRTGNVSELWSWLTHHQLARSNAATLFRDVEVAREPVERTLSVEAYLARIRTTNSYLHLSAEKRQRLEDGSTAVLEAHGGTYHASNFAILVTACRAA